MARPTPHHVWFTPGHCPACGNTNVRRSSIRGAESGAHAFRSPYRCEACRHRFWVVSHKARVGAAAAAVVAFAAIVFGVSLMVLPRYVTAVHQDREIEEWSASQNDIYGTTLTPKGMAAAALAPTEKLNSPLGGETLRSP